MRYIEKGTEPEILSGWKQLGNDEWKPSWDNLQNPEKSGLKTVLLQEQGYLCCYCCRGIELATSHIEHLKPRDGYSEEALDYTNLLACCMGEAEDPPPEQCHCGCHKENWYDPTFFVSPLDPDCERHFAYTAYGEIIGSAESDRLNAAGQTILQLNLNCKKLKRLRRLAIEGVLTGLETLTTDEIIVFRESLSRPDQQGMFVEFYPAIVHVLGGLI